jgi:hypothetical protein
MNTKVFLAAICLSLALCTQAFSDSAAPQPCCQRKMPVRGWLKAVFTVQCKLGPFCQNPPAPEPAAKDEAKDAPKDAPKDAAKDAPKSDAPPAPAVPVPNKTTGQ